MSDAGILDDKTGFCIQAKDSKLLMLHWVLLQQSC